MSAVRRPKMLGAKGHCPRAPRQNPLLPYCRPERRGRLMSGR
jgi:hypothetical protein